MGRIERTERMGRRKEAPEIVRSERHLLEREGRYRETGTAALR